MTNSARDIDRPATRNRYRNRTPGRKFNASTADGSNGPKTARANSQNRQRSNSPANHRQNFDRYTALARTALSSGDAIEAENYSQHAEHYFRLMVSV
jgi:hypothetical protein